VSNTSTYTDMRLKYCIEFAAKLTLHVEPLKK
jgi:hypothetical protein